MKKQILIIAIIFSVYLFFRFYNIGNRVSFGWDQEQFTYQVKQIVKDHKPVLLGPRTNNDRGFFLAPYFTYLITPFYLLTNLHPWALLIFILFYNFLFFFFCLFVLKKIFGFTHSLFFLSLWSINPMIAKYDYIPWWPILIPLGVITIWQLLKKISQQESIFNWVFLGIALGFFFNMHVQFALIILFALFFTFIDRSYNKLNVKKIIILFGFLALTFTPLLIFDLRHDFLNSKLLFGFFQKGFDNAEKSPIAWLPVFANFIQPIVSTKLIPVVILFYLIIFVFLIYLIRNKKKFLKHFYLSTLILWLIFPLFFAKYGQRPSEYYFIFLLPFINITIIDFLLTTNKKILLFIVIIIIFSFNLSSLQGNLKSEYLSLKYRDELIRNLIPITKNKKFNISFTVPLGLNSGFKYLLDYYDIKQTGNWSDPLIQIKIPADRSCQLKSGEMGILIPPELR